MNQQYCGDYYDRPEDNIQFLIDNGIEVKWQVMADNKQAKWEILESEQQIKKVLSPFTSPYWEEPEVNVSYRIPGYRLPLLEAREREEYREFREQMRIEYEKYCERRQQRIDAILAKKPWLEEPHTGFDMASEIVEGLVYDSQIAPEARV